MNLENILMVDEGFARIKEHILKKNPNMSEQEATRIAINSQQPQVTRRSFLKGLAAFGIGAALGIKPNDSHAYSVEQLPKLAQYSKQPILQEAFARMYLKEQLSGLPYRNTVEEVLTFNADYGYNMDPNTPFEDPLYWLAIPFHNTIFGGQITPGEMPISNEQLKEKNTNMFNWMNAMDFYFKTWVSRGNYSKILWQ